MDTATARRSTRQRKAPDRYTSGMNTTAPTDIDTKDQRLAVDQKSKPIKKKAPATKKKTPATKKKTPATKKKTPTTTTKTPTTTKKTPATTKKTSATKKKLTNKNLAGTVDDGEPKSKKARVVESFATEEEIAVLPALRGKIERLRREKLYVMSRNSISNVQEEFKVTGSTGNLYTVTIGPRLSCSCMSFRYQHTHCKHMLLILLRMFRLKPSSPIFTTTHPNLNVLRDIFANCTPDPSTLIPEELKAIIDRKLHGEPAASDIKTQRRPLDTSDCPICCGEFEEKKRQDILFCRVCGNNVHLECFNMWKNTKGEAVTCVYCRSSWEEPVKSIKNVATNAEGFINFSQEIGLSEKRDTTTYRHFPWRR